jgi:ribosome-associated protein
MARPPLPATQTADSNSPAEPLSKTRRKQAMTELQALGTTLVALPETQFRQLPMSERLMLAARDARKITDHEGRRRQLQYVGRLMRDEDEDKVQAMRAKLAAFKGESNAENARFHAMEKLRDAMLADDTALTRFVAEHAQTDVQRLRTLVREARKDAQAGKPPRHAHELFKLIRETLENEAGTAPS